MAVPAYIGSTAFIGGVVSAIAVAYGATARAAGDLLVVLGQADAPLSAPAGWTELSASPQTIGGTNVPGAVNLSAWWKISDGTEGNVSITRTGGSHSTLIGLMFRGVDQTNPINVAAGQTEATPAGPIFPAVSTTQPDCLIVNALGNDRDAASTTNLSAVTNAALANLTLRIDQTTTSGNGGGLGVITGELAVPGSSGQPTPPNVVAVNLAEITFAVAPPYVQWGVVAATLQNLASAATAGLLLRASSAPLLANLSAAAAGALQIKGAVAATLAPLQGSSAAALAVKATSSSVLANASLSATGQLRISAAGGGTLANLVSSAGARLAIKAGSGRTLADVTSSAQAVLQLTGQVATVLEDLTVHATATGGLALYAQFFVPIAADSRVFSIFSNDRTARTWR